MRRWLASALRTCPYPFPILVPILVPIPVKKIYLLTYCFFYSVLLQVVAFACAAEQQHVLADEGENDPAATTTPATSVETDVVEVVRGGWTPFQSGTIQHKTTHDYNPQSSEGNRRESVLWLT